MYEATVLLREINPRKQSILRAAFAISGTDYPGHPSRQCSKLAM